MVLGPRPNRCCSCSTRDNWVPLSRQAGTQVSPWLFHRNACVQVKRLQTQEAKFRILEALYRVKRR